MSNSYFSGRSGFGAGNNKKEERSRTSNSGASSAYITANSKIESSVEKINKCYDEVAQSVALYAISLNKDGVSNTKAIVEQINTLLRDFNSEDRIKILTKALSIIIVNM